MVTLASGHIKRGGVLSGCGYQIQSWLCLVTFFLANRSMKHSADSSVVKPPLDGSPSLDAPEYNNSKQYVNIVK